MHVKCGNAQALTFQCDKTCFTHCICKCELIQLKLIEDANAYIVIVMLSKFEIVVLREMEKSWSCRFTASESSTHQNRIVVEFNG